MTLRLAALVGGLLIVLAGCSTGAPPPAASSARSIGATAATSEVSSAPVTLTIYGAASLKGVLDKVRATYETANAGTKLTISTDSSATLETQIEQGAPADVFLSADTTNPQKLVERGLTAGAPVAFARNKLTIIVPTGTSSAIKTPADLAKAGIKVIAAGDAVPISRYAAQLVANLANERGYPADFAAKYTANIASKEDNVKAVVAKIELGEGDAGIVYVTDAKASNRVAIVAVPESANVPATYSGVVLKGSRNESAAEAFLTWLAGPGGQAVMSTYGFLSPS